MNKMKKLLSVLLAVLMILSSMTVLASAARTNYKTVADLKNLEAYSPYGQVTRLTTEERTSIVFDALDTILAQANINPGELFSLGSWSLTVDLRSVNALCSTLDSAKNLLDNVGILIGLLGDLADLDLDSWTVGTTRENTAQLGIIQMLLNVLSDNKGLVYDVISNGKIDLGVAGAIVGDLDLSIIANIPGLIKGLVYPMLERWDDTLTDIQYYDNNIANGGSVEEVINKRVKALFSDNMSITTVKYDVDGNMTSEHTGMPIQTSAPAAPSATSPRFVYVVNGTTPGSVMTVYHIVDAKEAETLAKDDDDDNDYPAYSYMPAEQTYTLTEEAGNGVYVWKALDDNGNVLETLKWYNDDSQLLPGISGDDIDLRTMSLSQILYTFVPVVFENMAPVVLNGSVKKILAEFLGAKFTYVGEGGPEADEAVLALADSSDAFFTQEQGEYLWEWSDYKVIGDNHYYRFENQIFEANLDNVNNYFQIINWNYNIDGDFMDEFVPTNGGSKDNTLLMNLNNFIVKVADRVFVASAKTVDSISGFEATWTKPTLTKGDNSNLVNNIKAIAQAVIGLAPQHVFGSDYAKNERCYVELMLSSDNNTVLTGIAAHLVNMLMPSMSLPGKSDLVNSNATVGAILAAVVREFAAQLTPEYNYDALIYADFGTTTADPVKTFISGKDNGYWLDVILTMGINIGFEYIRAFADMGEDTELWTSFVAATGYKVDGGTYTEADLKLTSDVNYWESMVDYIVDWALYDGYATGVITYEKDTMVSSGSGCNATSVASKTTVTEETTYQKYDWSWKFEYLVNTTGLTIDLATVQDPWVKLDQILDSLLPVDEILNVTATGGKTELEQLLRDNLILAIVDLRWDDLADMLKVPDGFVRSSDALDALAGVLKNLINGLFAKVGSTSSNYALIPADVTDFDSLANQANLATLVRDLLGALSVAAGRGLFDVVFPFVNFILGWTTDPQKLADPIITTSFRDGNDYAFQWNVAAGGAIDSENTLIRIINNSSGMLETHRNSSVEDHAYDINILSVTSDATVNKLTFTYSDNLLSPYEQVDIKIGGTYNADEATTVTIAYDYVGKDGEPVGGTQYTSVSFLVSNLYEDSNYSTCQPNDHDKDYTGLTDVKGYVFTEDLYKSVTEYTAEIHYVSGGLNPSRNFVSCQPEANGAITAPASNYFAQYQGNESGEWAATLSKDGTSSTTAHLYYALDGVTEDTEFAYGAYDMGEIGVKYGSDTKVIIVDFIYYNDYDIYDIYTANRNNGYNANQGVDSTIWEAYRTAWNKVVYLATYPMMTTSRSTANWEGETAKGTAENDYVTVIQPQIPAAIEAYEEAKAAYEKALAEAQSAGASGAALPQYVQNLAAVIEDDYIEGNAEKGGKEIDFQDVEFYEYFNYSDVKTAGENMYRTYLAPDVMDQYYILNSGIRQAELDKVIAAETNEYVAAGITASRLENDPAAVAASKTAYNEWKLPTTSKLVVEDLAARIEYYEQFVVMDASREGTEHKQFLDKEIAHIDAQQLVEANYTEASWANFKEAYDYAKAVQAGTADYSDYNSTIFSAKWELMVAYKNLLEKSRSLIEAGGTDALNANIEKAEAIFAGIGDTWQVKDGVDADTAYAALISALGYYYVGEDGNTWNLYADSAYEYRDNDRPDNQNNQAKVNTANAALEAAILNFEEVSAEPNTLAIKEDYADSGIVIDKLFISLMITEDWFPEFAEAEDANATGLVYGFDSLLYVGNEDELTLADVLTTAYGDDYLQITAMEASDGWETTGTKIEVLDNDGKAIETYYFVYFGDINGDGAVDSSDVTVATRYNRNGDSIETLAQLAAADMNGDAFVESSDVTLLARANRYEEYAEQDVIAADFYACVEEYAAE